MNNIIFRNCPPALPPADKNSKKKTNINKLKNNTINSLNEVEIFLNDLHRFKRYVKLYKILK